MLVQCNFNLDALNIVAAHVGNVLVVLLVSYLDFSVAKITGFYLNYTFKSALLLGRSRVNIVCSVIPLCHACIELFIFTYYKRCSHS